MRVAHLLPNMVTGGRERMVAELCRHSYALGIEPTLIFYDPDIGDAAQIACDAPVLAINRNSASFAKSLRSALGPFDLVHAQGHISAHYVRQSGHAGPSVATIHVGMERNWRWLYSIRQGLRAMDQLTAVSEPLAKLYSRIAGRTVELVANGISLELFAGHRAQPPQSNDSFRFVMLSRLHEVKGHRDAIAAMDSLVANGLKAELLIAGEGPMESELQNLAATRPHISLVGPVTDAPAFLSGHHAFLLCSKHEGMPLAVVEAMAVGLPVICADIKGITATTGSAALLVQRQRPKDLVGAMQRLTTNPSLWKGMSEHSLQQSLKYDAHTVAEQYAEIYERLLLK